MDLGELINTIDDKTAVRTILISLFVSSEKTINKLIKKKI